jgi:hypothetical protein
VRGYASVVPPSKEKRCALHIVATPYLLHTWANRWRIVWAWRSAPVGERFLAYAPIVAATAAATQDAGVITALTQLTFIVVAFSLGRFVYKTQYATASDITTGSIALRRPFGIDHHVHAVWGRL